MKLEPYLFSKKCDIDMCQNESSYYIELGAKGKLLLCRQHAAELAKITSGLAINPNEKLSKTNEANSNSKTSKNCKN